MAPDRRIHRSSAPQDLEQLGRGNESLLVEATSQYAWLLSRGYAARSALKLVGDRHRLTARQREALARCACTDEQREHRRAKLVEPAELRGGRLWIDGYNVLTTVESALGGGVVLQGRDGCWRDLARAQRTHRPVLETLPAIHAIGEFLAALGLIECRWLLDRPVSNSGRMGAELRALSAANGWDFEVELASNVDRVLSGASAVVASADSAILEACGRWANLARNVLAARRGAIWLLDLSGEDPPEA
jgi:hypothetical protein